MKCIVAKRIAALALCLLSSIGASKAQDAVEPWRINNIPLDMPLEADLNGEYLEGIYQEKLLPRIIDSVGIDWPSHHIMTTLRGAKGSGDEKMELYFSSPADGEKLFWIRVHRTMEGVPQKDSGMQALAMLERSFGVADRLYASPESPGSAILVFVDKKLPDDQRRRIAGNLPSPATFSSADFTNFWAMSLAERTRLLSPDFRGAIAIVNAWSGELRSLQLELLDLRGAATVFTLR